MFGRGNWAIVGIAKDSLEAFKTNLEDRGLMIAVSQLAASAVTRHIKLDALGINPFSAPRLDEQHEMSLDHQQELARYAGSSKEERSNDSLPAEILNAEGYGFGEQNFELHSTLPWYGLWAVSNQWKDVSDLATVKEQHAYSVLERPYKFLQATDKNSVDQEIRGTTASVRKQLPVLLDFNEGRAYIENSSKKSIQAVTELLKQVGVETIAVAWTYSHPSWPAEILNKLHQGTQYQNDFVKRADEATRFKANEIEKLEDKEVESIVANYFSMTQLPSELWAGISAPAQIRLHATSLPIAVKAPTTATTLLGMTSDAHLLSGSITIQERVTYMNKKGEERTFRKDVVSIDINDQINITDVGAAMLRGFDIPAFKKDLQREIRQTKQVPSIDEFWSTWLHQMSNAVRTIEASFREILDIDGAEKAGILAMQALSSDEVLELNNA
ncbi:MAG TPA: hypothetical protein VK604_27550 [Bryobacteraceae bacterium]|nr:hypothetical protein [Bryobacteraceae bacterium]